MKYGNLDKLTIPKNMDYSRTEVAVAARPWLTKFGWLGRVGSELPRVGYNEADAVRLVRPEGKRS